MADPPIRSKGKMLTAECWDLQPIRVNLIRLISARAAIIA